MKCHEVAMSEIENSTRNSILYLSKSGDVPAMSPFYHLSATDRVPSHAPWLSPAPDTVSDMMKDDV